MVTVCSNDSPECYLSADNKKKCTTETEIAFKYLFVGMKDVLEKTTRFYHAPMRTSTTITNSSTSSSSANSYCLIPAFTTN